MTDATAGRVRTSPSANAPRRRSSRVPILLLLLIIAMIAAVFSWPAEVRKIVAKLMDTPPAPSPSASIAVTPSASSRAPSAPATPSLSIPLTPSTPAPSASPPTAAPPPSPPPASETRSADGPPRVALAEPPPLDVEGRLNALEARTAALLEQPIVTPSGLAEALAQSRRAMEEEARVAAQEAARAMAQSAAEAAVKNAGPPAELSASVADLAQRLAELEKTAVSSATLADLAQRMAAMERASTAFAALVDLERRTGALEKVTSPLASVGDLSKRLAEAERASAAVGALSQRAARGDALILGLLTLRDALDRGAPYGDLLAGLRAAAAGDEGLTAEVERLAPLAERGVPTVAALRQSLADLSRGETGVKPMPLAKDESSNELSAETRTGLSQIWHRITSSVSIRRIEPSAAQISINSPAERDEALGAAQALLAANDVAGAIRRLDDESLRLAFDAPRRAALESWLGDARARLAADSAFAALSRRGLALTAPRAAASAAPLSGAPPSGSKIPGATEPAAPKPAALGDAAPGP